MTKRTILQDVVDARRLAEALAAIVRNSGLPQSDWHEVVERLISLLKISMPVGPWPLAEDIAEHLEDLVERSIAAPSPDASLALKELMEASAQHIQVNAMMVALLPAEEREVIYGQIEARLRNSPLLGAAAGPLAEEWLAALISDLRWYVGKIDSSGGAKGGNA